MRAPNWLLMLAVAGLGLAQLSCDNRKQAETAQSTVAGKMPRIQFAETGIYDFGTLTEGDTVEHVFRFTNTGEFPLIINNITASCGCTTPSWTKEPVAPGAQGTMEVQFDSRGKNGIINKQVAERANTQPSITTIAIKGNVLNAAGATDKPL